MLEDLQYLENTNPLVTAASVGISRRRWIATTREEIKSGEAIKTMAENHFDVLPIVDHFDGNEIIRSYYKTVEKGKYDKAETHEIKGIDLLRQERNIRTVIRRMAEEEREFYFLIHNHVITGMISTANLNSRQVQAFIFHLIIELETALAEFLNMKVDHEEVVGWIKGRSKTVDGTKNKCTQILSEYESNLNAGYETNISEHFYLVDLMKAIMVLHKTDLDTEKLNITRVSGKKFKSMTKELNELRNLAGHPVKSLIDHKNTLKDLNSRLDLLDETLFELLNNHLSHKIR